MPLIPMPPMPTKWMTPDVEGKGAHQAISRLASGR